MPKFQYRWNNSNGPPRGTAMYAITEKTEKKIHIFVNFVKVNTGKANVINILMQKKD